MVAPTVTSPAIALGVQAGLSRSSTMYTTTAVPGSSCAICSAATWARGPTSARASKAEANSATGTSNADFRVALNGVPDVQIPRDADRVLGQIAPLTANAQAS